MSKFRTRNGVRERLCGGYVSWDSRRKDLYGFPIRRQKEVHVWLDASHQVDDCGKGTDALVKALLTKVGPKVEVRVSECWEV